MARFDLTDFEWSVMVGDGRKRIGHEPLSLELA